MHAPIGVIRALRLVFVWLIAGNIFDSAALILWAKNSDTLRLATMTNHPQTIGWLFLLCLALLIPLGASTLSLSGSGVSRFCAILATAGAMVAALMWAGLAFVGKNADLNAVQLLHIKNAIEAMVFSVIISATVNDGLRCSRNIKHADFGDSNKIDLQ